MAYHTVETMGEKNGFSGYCYRRRLLRQNLFLLKEQAKYKMEKRDGTFRPKGS